MGTPERLVIGLVGGVASGKSTVAAMLARRGLMVLDADAEARAVVADPDVLDRLEARFGPSIRGPDGTLDRAELARLAFADETATADLNALVHPEVRRRLLEALAAAEGRPVVLDVPLLLESPLADLVTLWVFVEASEGVRDERAAGRSWAPGERRKREERQAGLDAKAARADLTLENNGSIDDLELQVDALLRQIGAA